MSSYCIKAGDAQFGGKTLVNNFKKMGFEEPQKNKHYDIAIGMFTHLEDVDANRKIIVVSDRDTGGLKRRWLNKAFEGDISKFKSFTEGIALSKNTSLGSPDYLEKLEKITGISFRQEDINFYTFNDVEPLPLSERNDRIVNIGRVNTFKGNWSFISDREKWVNDIYPIVNYGSNLYTIHESRIYGTTRISLTNTGNRLTKTGGFGKGRKWIPEIHCDYELKEGVAVNWSYDIPTDKTVFNLYPNYTKDEKFLKLLQQSRFGIFPYPEHMIYSFEYSPLEALDYGLPLVLMRPFAENFTFCHKNYPLTEEHGFIVLDDPSELVAKCKAFEEGDYLGNVKKQKEYVKSFYKNETILENIIADKPKKLVGFQKVFANKK